MLCKHGNISPCAECDIWPLEARSEKLVEALEYLMETYPASRHLQDTCSAALTAYRKHDGLSFIFNEM